MHDYSLAIMLSCRHLVHTKYRTVGQKGARILPEKLLMTSTMIYTVAVASKIDKALYYTAKALQQVDTPIEAGALVKVPLGKRQVTGIVLAADDKLPSDLAGIKLKSIQALISPDLWLTEELSKLLSWAATYYHQPFGKVLSTALPSALLKGSLDALKSDLGWVADPNYPNIDAIPELARAHRQKELFQWILNHPLKTEAEIKQAGFDRALLKQLEKKELIQAKPLQVPEGGVTKYPELIKETPLALGSEQSNALKTILSTENKNAVYLLEGVTGSGKTEVYLQAAQRFLEQRKQVLVLVPEIGLIHQTQSSFQRRFNAPIYTYTSECSETEKLDAWRAARKSSPSIFIGTRSAIFLPLANAGMIAVDEEHDLSYKQQEGFRYQARDLATLRSRNLNVPLIMGSATPSIESLKNAKSGVYQHLSMYHRVAGRPLPSITLTAPSQTPGQTVSSHCLTRIQEELQKDSQVMVFINRRGYAPRLSCTNCAWLALCPQCDTALCKHASPPLLICHHCDYRITEPTSCPRCNSTKLSTQGVGTEQLEKNLQAFFPNTVCIRVDRDSTSRKGGFRTQLQPAMDGTPCILIGTQMLAKGHHLPKLSLAVIVDADQALFSHDYRASEQLGQQITQVAGRTGRGAEKGELVIETAYPDHPLLVSLTSGSYSEYTTKIIAEREQRQLPPYAYAAVLRAESTNLEALIHFMGIAAETNINKKIDVIGPMPAVMERRRGRFRYQLNLSSGDRKALHQALAKLSFSLHSQKGLPGIRWGIDVDPLTND